MGNTVRRFYNSTEMARVSSSACAGCGACCRGMGDTVVLDPYDIWLLTNGLHRDFRELLDESIDLHIEEKLILPHLAMRDSSAAEAEGGSTSRQVFSDSTKNPHEPSNRSGSEGGSEEKRKQEGYSEDCFYLGTDGKCTIHEFRPGICRLFPLGRQYEGDKVSYFVVEGGCVRSGRGLSKVRIDKWLGIPELDRYEQFKARWHTLVRSLQTMLSAQSSVEIVRQINRYFLQVFFMTPYRGRDFYLQADRRIHLFEKKVFIAQDPGEG